MTLFTISLLVLIQHFSWSEEVSVSELLSQYETLQPFHENMAIIMPVEKCENKNRSSKKTRTLPDRYAVEDHFEPFEELLHKTENFVDTANPDFVHTSLGQKYQQLKTLMNIHKQLKSCSPDNSVISDDILYRTQSNISIALENPDECKPVLSDSENSTTLFANHLQHINNKNMTTESDFEDNLFAQALKTSIQTRINFTRQTEDGNINTQDFKQKLLDQFCTGNTPVSTSRGTRDRKGWICSEKDEEIISNLIREAVNSADNKELIQHPTKLSHQKEDCFTIRRNSGTRNCVNKNIYEFQSTPPKLAGEGQIDSLTPPVIVSDINNRIADLNSILEDYNDQKKELEEAWALENKNPRQEEYSSLPEKRQSEYEYALKRKKFNDELKRLKKIAFLEYKQELALLHSSGAGALLQTNAVRNKSKFKELEKITSKGLGILGFEEAELTHKNDFPLLEPIDDHTAHMAVQERFQRIDQHIKDLLSDQRNKQKTDQEYLDRLQQGASEEDLKKWYNDQRSERLSKLVLSNPQTISSVLLNNPEYSSTLCKVAHKIEKDNQFRENLITGVFIGSIVGSITISILTAGAGAPASFTTTLSLTVGTGLTAADFTWRMSEINRHRRNQEDMLNAYLSQTGDDQSIEDIRKEWKSKVKQHFHAGWAVTLGTFDVFRISSTIKKAKLAKKEALIPSLYIQNNQIQKIITDNDQYMESIQGLLQKHPVRSVQRALNSIRKLPLDQQRIVLDSLSRISQHDSFNFTAFSREMKRAASKKRVLQILSNWAVCHTCRVKAGTRKQKDSSDARSVIESSQL